SDRRGIAWSGPVLRRPGHTCGVDLSPRPLGILRALFDGVEVRTALGGFVYVAVAIRGPAITRENQTPESSAAPMGPHGDRVVVA
ncbi:MAG: hypothetical protein ACT4PT_03100, partial [Methanobacteriota archaeon]